MRLSRMRLMALWGAVGAAFVTGAILLVFMRQTTALSQSEATRRAERFIAENGYTDLPPDRSRMVPEPVVLSSTVDEELEMRRDTLERHADGATGGADGWVVLFRYKHRDTEWRRAVVMDAKGGHTHIMHEDAW